MCCPIAPSLRGDDATWPRATIRRVCYAAIGGCQRPEAVIGVETLGLCYTHMRVRRFIRRLAHLCLLLDIWANYAA